MFNIKIEYIFKGRTPGVWIVDPEYLRECHGESLVEVLSKFVLEVAQLQEKIKNDEIRELRSKDDDIPF